MYLNYSNYPNLPTNYSSPKLSPPQLLLEDAGWPTMDSLIAPRPLSPASLSSLLLPLNFDFSF